MSDDCEEEDSKPSWSGRQAKPPKPPFWLIFGKIGKGTGSGKRKVKPKDRKKPKKPGKPKPGGGLLGKAGVSKPKKVKPKKVKPKRPKKLKPTKPRKVRNKTKLNENKIVKRLTAIFEFIRDGPPIPVNQSAGSSGWFGVGAKPPPPPVKGWSNWISYKLEASEKKKVKGKLKKKKGQSEVKGLMKGPNMPRMILLIFNILVMVAGVVSIIVGAKYLGGSIFTDPLIGKDSDASPVFLVIMGFMIIALAFFCTYGMYFQNYHVLIMYMGLMLVIVALQLAMATIGLLRWTNTTYNIKQHLFNAYEAVSVNPVISPVTKAFHNFQKEHQCCGMNGPGDYTNGFPTSCCSKSPCIPETGYPRGCEKVALDVFHKAIFLYFIFLIGVAIICAINTLLTLFVAKYIWNFRPEQGFRIYFTI